MTIETLDVLHADCSGLDPRRVRPDARTDCTGRIGWRELVRFATAHRAGGRRWCMSSTVFAKAADSAGVVTRYCRTILR
jgi:hypothetical protein